MAQISVVLTFDDGPHALADRNRNYTLQALRILKTNRVQADTKGVFFVQTHVPHRGGSKVGREVIQRIWAEGHVVGIHSGSVEDHVPHTQRRGELRGDLVGAKGYLQELGIANSFVRPVGGQTNSAVLATYRDLGLRMVLWDVDSRDSHSGYDKDRITAHLRQRVGALAGAGKSEVVVLFHELDSDTRGNIEHYMETIAKSFQEAGHETRFPTTRNDVLAVLQRYARS